MKLKKGLVNSTSNLLYLIWLIHFLNNLLYFKMGRVPAYFVISEDHLLLMKMYFSFKNVKAICRSRNIVSTRNSKRQ